MSKIIIVITLQDVAEITCDTRYAFEYAVCKKVVEKLKIDKKQFKLRLGRMTITELPDTLDKEVEVEYEINPIEKPKDITKSYEDEIITKGDSNDHFTRSETT